MEPSLPLVDTLFTSLPLEILATIFTFLDETDLLSVMRVCLHWRDAGGLIINKQFKCYWRVLLKRIFDPEPIQIKCVPKTPFVIIIPVRKEALLFSIVQCSQSKLKYYVVHKLSNLFPPVTGNAIRTFEMYSSINPKDLSEFHFRQLMSKLVDYCILDSGEILLFDMLGFVHKLNANSMEIIDSSLIIQIPSGSRISGFEWTSCNRGNQQLIFICGGKIHHSKMNVSIYPGWILFDADQFISIRTGTLHIPRHSHCCSFIPSIHSVLITGGLSSAASSWAIQMNILSQAELFQIDSEQLHELESHSLPRARHQSVLKSNGNVILAGGQASDLSFAEVFDSQTYRFEPLSGHMTSSNNIAALVPWDKGYKSVIVDYQSRHLEIFDLFTLSSGFVSQFLPCRLSTDSKLINYEESLAIITNDATMTKLILFSPDQIHIPCIPNKIRNEIQTEGVLFYHNDSHSYQHRDGDCFYEKLEFNCEQFQFQPDSPPKLLQVHFRNTVQHNDRLRILKKLSALDSQIFIGMDL